jgi:hypothetical protein
LGFAKQPNQGLEKVDRGGSRFLRFHVSKSSWGLEGSMTMMSATALKQRLIEGAKGRASCEKLAGTLRRLLLHRRFGAQVLGCLFLC